MPVSLKYSEHHYTPDNELQKLGVWEYPVATDDVSKYWVM